MSGKILGEKEDLGCQKIPWKKLKVFEIEVGKNCFFKIVWGLTSGTHWRTCSVGGSPCIITRKPEWQLAGLLSLSLFVAGRCHYLLLIPQTGRQQHPLHLPPLNSCQALQPHKVQEQNLHLVFEAKTVSPGLHVD